MEDEESGETSRDWKKMVQMKYGRDNGGWYMGASSSYAWKCIQKTLEGRMINKRWRVGDGRGIRMWWDRWILEEPLGRYPWVIDASLIDDRKVSDIIDRDGTWDFTEAARLLPEGVVNQLHQIVRATTDSCFSSNSIGGKYSVALAYKNMSKYKEPGRAMDNWKPGRYLISRRIWWFIWKLIRDRLPTKENLQRRNVVTEGTCALCGDHLESIQHLFLECPVAVRFWTLFQEAFNWKLNAYNMDIILVRMTNTKKMDAWMANSQGLTGLGLWMIWKTRNDIIFRPSHELVSEKTRIKAAVVRAIATFKESWTLRTFSLLEHDLRFEA